MSGFNFLSMEIQSESNQDYNLTVRFTAKFDVG